MIDLITNIELKQILYLMYKQSEKTITVNEKKKLDSIMKYYAQLYERMDR